MSAESNAYAKERHRIMIEAGLCTRCSAPHPGGGWYCAECKAKVNKASRDWREIHGKEREDRRRDSIKTIKEALRLAAGGRCAICGIEAPECLDFHHIDGTSKTASVSSLVEDHAKMSEILREAEGCILICANCHALEHTRESGHRDSVRHRQIKADIVTRMGGVCSRCGISGPNEMMHFHHVGPKSFSIKKAIHDNYPVAEINEEIKNCIMLCANCHRHVHSSNGDENVQEK